MYNGANLAFEIRYSLYSVLYILVIHIEEKRNIDTYIYQGFKERPANVFITTTTHTLCDMDTFHTFDEVLTMKRNLTMNMNQYYHYRAIDCKVNEISDHSFHQCGEMN